MRFNAERLNLEKIQAPLGGRKFGRQMAEKGEQLNRHYSEKGSHALRSVGNVARKISKRRGNYK